MTKILPVTKKDIAISQRPKRAISWVINLEAMCPQDIHKAHVPVQLLPQQTPHKHSESKHEGSNIRFEIWRQATAQLRHVHPATVPHVLVLQRWQPGDRLKTSSNSSIWSESVVTQIYMVILVYHLMQASLTKSLPMETHLQRHRCTLRIASIQNRISPLSQSKLQQMIHMNPSNRTHTVSITQHRCNPKASRTVLHTVRIPWSSCCTVMDLGFTGR